MIGSPDVCILVCVCVWGGGGVRRVWCIKGHLLNLSLYIYVIQYCQKPRQTFTQIGYKLVSHWELLG